MFKYLTALLVAWATTGAALAQESQHEITHVAGGLYRVQHDSHVSVAYVWDSGVVLTDPKDPASAAWLMQHLSGITDKPVTHLIFSHSDADHASGGAEFGAVPQVIAQANAPETLDGVRPTTRFDDTLTIPLGDQSIELTYLGPGHGTDSVAMVFRPENAAFVVDVVAVHRLPYRDFGNSDIDALFDQIDKVQALDFDVLVGGHGPAGNKANVAEYRQYIEKLRAAVADGLAAGKSVEQLKTELTLDEYSDWLNYAEWRELNIEGMARYLQAGGT